MFAVVSANAQNTIDFGVKAGITVSNIKKADGLIGFTLGTTANYGLSKALFLQSGLFLITKGYSTTYIGVSSSKDKTTVRPIFLQLPIHLAYKINVGQNSKIVFNAGPYLAYGLGGKIKNAPPEGCLIIEKQPVFDKYNGFKRFDYGLGFGTGMEFGKLGFNVGYDLGLVDLSRDDISAKLNCLSITAAYKY